MFFGVSKKGKRELRFIFDRRPQNATNRRLRWATLPQPSQLRFLQLKHNESFSGDSEDLRVYFCRLEHEDAWVRHNAVGEPVSGSWLSRYGAAGTDRQYFVCLIVWGMGDVSSADVAQRVHEEVLSGLHDPTTRIRYGEPLPDGRLLVGIYLDDFLFAHRHPTGQVPDSAPLRIAQLAYEHHDLDTATEKSFAGQTDFYAWGAICRGRVGTLGISPQYRGMLLMLLSRFFLTGLANRRIMEQILGIVVAVTSYRRESLCLAHHAYKFTASLPETGWHTMAPDIRDELLPLALRMSL